MPKKNEQTFESALQKALDDTDLLIQTLQSLAEQYPDNMAVRLCIYRESRQRTEIAESLARLLKAESPTSLTMIVNND